MKKITLTTCVGHNVPSLPRAPAAPSPWLPPAWGTGPAALPELPSLPEEHSGHPFLSLSSRCLSLSVTRESIRALPAHVLAVEDQQVSLLPKPEEDWEWEGPSLWSLERQHGVEQNPRELHLPR